MYTHAHMRKGVLFVDPHYRCLIFREDETPT